MNLFFKQAGEGKALLLLHGLFGSLENLGMIARPLSEKFQTYSLDLPNHGRSPHDDHISLESLADSVVTWMDQQKLENVSLVGHSLGGKTAMEIALAQPERIEKLAVIDIAPVAYQSNHDDVFAGLLAIDPEQLNSREEADEMLANYLHDSTLRSFLLKNLIRDQVGRFAWRMNLKVLHRDYMKILEANRDGNYDGPVLFLKGEHSNYIKDEYKPAVISRFPKAQMKIIQGTRHWLHAEKPEMVSRALSKFLLS